MGPKICYNKVSNSEVAACRKGGQKLDGIINLLQDLFSQLGDRIVALFSYAWHWVMDNPATAGEWYSGLIRRLMPVLALMI